MYSLIYKVVEIIWEHTDDDHPADCYMVFKYFSNRNSTFVEYSSCLINDVKKARYFADKLIAYLYEKPVSEMVSRSIAFFLMMAVSQRATVKITRDIIEQAVREDIIETTIEES